MRIIDFPLAPNPRKLRTYIAEKGIEMTYEVVNLARGEQKTPEFLKINPAGSVPVLELDDGSHLTESLAIIEYLEELHPEPPMIGTTPLERARVRALERQAELGVLGPTARWVHATRSPLPGVEPTPEIAEHAYRGFEPVLARLGQALGDAPFIAGERPTIADCTLFAAWEFGALFGLDLPAPPNLRAWHARFRERPGALIR